MNRRAGAYVLVAVTALGFGFFFATQVRAQLILPGNRVARNEALLRSAQDLEARNADYRKRIAQLRNQVGQLEANASEQSDSVRQAQEQVADLEAHAGLSPLHGPGVSVTLANGVPGPDVGGKTGYLVNFQDIQDVVNLLYQGGAEGGAGSAVMVAVIAALVAFVGVLQVRSQAAVERSLEGQDNTSLAFLIDDLHQSNDELATEQAQLEIRRQALQGGGSSAALNELNSEAQRLRMVEGLLPVHGAGVTIYIVAPLSSIDVQDAFNNLQVGGAQAVAINERRVITG